LSHRRSFRRYRWIRPRLVVAQSHNYESARTKECCTETHTVKLCKCSEGFYGALPTFEASHAQLAHPLASWAMPRTSSVALDGATSEEVAPCWSCTGRDITIRRRKLQSRQRRDIVNSCNCFADVCIQHQPHLEAAIIKMIPEASHAQLSCPFATPAMSRT
jgi:hypothetical protein